MTLVSKLYFGYQRYPLGSIPKTCANYSLHFVNRFEGHAKYNYLNSNHLHLNSCFNFYRSWKWKFLLKTLK